MPRLRYKSKQFLFKNKLNIRRKSKKKLLKESFLMMILGFFLLLINYLIPRKMILIKSFNQNVFEILKNLMEICSYFFEILIVVLIFFSLLISIFLIFGSFNRILKVFSKRSQKIRVR
tara:strand:- start:163 stop:516 length:354 start_codon:yes stop_codon:yes gene_type:complete